jgi:hypothetical protein
LQQKIKSSGAVILKFDGERLDEDETLESCDIEDGDQLEGKFL